MDAVGHRPVRCHAVGPLVAAVPEADAGSEDVPAVPGVGQVRERRGQLEGDLTVRGDADRLVAEALAGLTLGSQEPAFALPTAAATRPR